MTLSKADKGLVAVAVSVAAGCRPCTTHHLVGARRAGASDAAIAMAVAGAVCVRNNATEAMRRHGLGLDPVQGGCGCPATQPVEELVALGASLAVNCTSNIDKHLDAARALGVPQGHLDEVFALVEAIRSKAVEHARGRVCGEAARGSNWAEAPASPGCC